MNFTFKDLYDKEKNGYSNPDNGGIVPSLTELCPKLMTHTIRQYFDMDQTTTPIACTWTYPTDKKLYSDKKALLIDQSFDQQIKYMENDILKKWLRKCNTFIRKSELCKIEIYYERTKQGQIHAHGILWYDDVGMYSQFYLLMASAWAKISGGSVKAMSKTVNGRTNHAFDKCNNTEKWIEYIRKEQTEGNEYFSQLEREGNENARTKKKNETQKLREFHELIEINFE